MVSFAEKITVTNVSQFFVLQCYSVTVRVGGRVVGDGYCADRGGIHTVTSDALHTHLQQFASNYKYKYKYVYNYGSDYN